MNKMEMERVKEEKVESQVAPVQEARQELTTEQYKAICMQLSEQNRALYKQVQELSNEALFKRAEYLLKIIEIGYKFPSEFVDNCVNEMVSLLTPPENSEEPESTKSE